MKLYFNKNFGEYVCAGNGIAAMDVDKTNAIKMALDMIDRDNTEKAINEMPDELFNVEEARATGN